MLPIDRSVLQAHEQRDPTPKGDRHQVGSRDSTDLGPLHGDILLLEKVKAKFETRKYNITAAANSAPATRFPHAQNSLNLKLKEVAEALPAPVWENHLQIAT